MGLIFSQRDANRRDMYNFQITFFKEAVCFLFSLLFLLLGKEWLTWTQTQEPCAETGRNRPPACVAALCTVMCEGNKLQSHGCFITTAYLTTDVWVKDDHKFYHYSHEDVGVYVSSPCLWEALWLLWPISRPRPWETGSFHFLSFGTLSLGTLSHHIRSLTPWDHHAEEATCGCASLPDTWMMPYQIP